MKNNYRYKRLDEIVEIDNDENQDKKSIDKPVKIKKLVKMFLSDKLKNVLTNLLKTGDPLSKAVVKKLLDLEDSNKLYEFSYLDIIKGNNDSLSFLSAIRAWKLLEIESSEESLDMPDDDNVVWTTTQRQNINCSRIISKIFDDEFSVDAVQRFSNSFKAEIDSMSIFDNFEVVDGENIRYWYQEKNYEAGQGTLNGSCMRYDKAQQYLDLYCKNPEKCGLVILKSKNNKIFGRALLWKDLKKPLGKTFMDRIYTTKQSYEDIFKKYAIEQGWLYKYSQSAQDSSYMDGDKKVYDGISLVLYVVPYVIEGEGENRVIKIMKSKIPKYQHYPYMDTMKYFTPDTGRLASDIGQASQYRKLRLESTEGGSNNI